MRKIVYIGADGGGTKTAICASDFSSENSIITCEGASINYNFIGIEKAATNFAEAIRKLSLPDDTEIAGIAIGDPSVDDLNPSPLTESFISLIREHIQLSPQCPIYITSDVYMTLYGMTEGKPGILMVSGTGSMGMAIDAKGALYITGGWGRLTEDEGSGYFIAINGIKSALRYFDQTGPATVLLDEMKHYFNIVNPRDFILKYYANSKAFPEIAGFSKIVGNVAIFDEEAMNIINKCADLLITGTLALFRKANLRDCAVGIYGSVLLGNQLIRKRFESGILEAYPHAKIIVPAIKPEMAALKYIKQKEKIK